MNKRQKKKRSNWEGWKPVPERRVRVRVAKRIHREHIREEQRKAVYDKRMQQAMEKDGQQDIQNVIKQAEELKKKFGDIRAGVNECIKALWQAAVRILEGVRRAEDLINTDEMLKNAYAMPEYTDKNLLEHVGVKMDRFGFTYDFYYDPENGVYFVEEVGERKW